MDGVETDITYVGFSLGVLPAQLLAQTRPGAHAALFAHSCVPPSEFGRGWPDGVPLQLHLTEDDPLALPPNTDLEAARALADGGAELFLYPGTDHLFDAHDHGAVHRARAGLPRASAAHVDALAPHA